jgi:hypothetical protein
MTIGWHIGIAVRIELAPQQFPRQTLGARFPGFFVAQFDDFVRQTLLNSPPSLRYRTSLSTLISSTTFRRA